MPTPASSVTNTVIVERIEALRCDVRELSASVKEFVGQLNTLEKRYLEGHIPLVDTVTEHEKRISMVESELKDLVKVSQSQEHRLKWISSVLGLIGTAVILYMVGIVLPRLFGS